MFISNLCGPAILYIGFSLIQIIIDCFKNNYENALIKFIIMIVLSTLLNILCNIGFSIISWFLVFIPIIMMTIMSTLTLRIFGLEPDSDQLRSNVKKISNDFDSSGNYYGQHDYINRTSHDTIERIDRDIIRKDLYDKIESTYKLDSKKDHHYDLSKNPIKYRLTDALLNNFGDNYFMNNIINSNLYQRLFNNISSLNINESNYTVNSIDNYLTNLRNSNISIVNNDVTPDASWSYANTSQVANLYNGIDDGFLLYRDEVLDNFIRDFPEFSSGRRDILIENEWNNLSDSQQEVYNNRASRSSRNSRTSSSYSANDLSSYRSPLVSLNYKRNRENTLSSSAQCPPGQIISGNNCIDSHDNRMVSLNNI